MPMYPFMHQISRMESSPWCSHLYLFLSFRGEICLRMEGPHNSISQPVCCGMSRCALEFWAGATPTAGWSHAPTWCHHRQTDRQTGGVAPASVLHPCAVFSCAPPPPVLHTRLLPPHQCVPSCLAACHPHHSTFGWCAARWPSKRATGTESLGNAATQWLEYLLNCKYGAFYRMRRWSLPCVLV